MPTKHIVVHDVLGQGAAWARNTGAAMCRTPFISFLDADDWLMPDFSQRMLERVQPGRYVYCDWQRDGVLNRMPDRVPVKQSYALHINTTVMHLERFRWLGGYDEQAAFEDTEFYFRAMSRGVCGIHCPHSLVEYTGDGQRSLRAVALQNELITIYQRYHAMADCNCGGTNPHVPIGEQQVGDVLVMTDWGGKRAHKGSITGRNYPPAGNGKKAWVAAEDAQAGVAILGPGGQKGVYVVVASDPVEPQKDFEDLRAEVLSRAVSA